MQLFATLDSLYEILLFTFFTMPDATTVNWSELLRDRLKNIESEARRYVQFIKDSHEDLHDKWECIAQAMLALRHIEDARMRFGKVIQYATTGESNYHK